ncbi:hypothetical protein [Maritalea porphyrae]|uniref:hypothetical protein n=1 Tax=Maritalea porphyrae TaxID=880732 RepID=UPI0022AE9A2E|nr:hypothetical protein [Maritalea porphyrae]MCZ4273329.1 hypothetical protein [Maritalea porphyrae]
MIDQTGQNQTQLAPGEIQTTMLSHLCDGTCKTIDQLESELALNRRQISDGARLLIIRGYAERIELGCYRLTELGQDATMNGEVITSGPISKDSCTIRKPFANTIRQRAWRTMRMGDAFTIPSLTMAAATNKDKQPENNLQRYVKALVKAGYLVAYPVPQKGNRVGSNGFKRYRLINNTGPHAPTMRRGKKVLFDRNLNEGQGGEVPWT